MSSHFFKTKLNFLAMLGAVVSLAGCNDAPPDNTTASETEAVQVSSLTDAYKEVLEKRVEAGRSVGLAVVLVDDDQHGFINVGMADIASGKQIDENTLFEIGSITKTFTTIIFADMVMKGEVGLDDPVSKYLPDAVTMPEFDGKQITLKDLATHTSALPRMPDNFNPADPNNPYADYTPDLIYAFLSGHTLERAIGEEVAYSNLGMGLLAHVLELHTSKSYEQLVTDRVLAPLGMSDTFMTIPATKKVNFAVGHDAAGEPASYWDIATLSGAGALRSDIADMTIYLKANMGLIDTPLAGAMELSHKFQYEAGNEGSYIGLGWFTQYMDGQSVTWHNGGTGGFKTFLGFDKESKRGVVVLANSQDMPELIGRAILTQKPESLEPDVEDTSLKFTPEALERFVGDYQLAPEFIISITRNDDKLFAQATGQQKFPIFAKSEMEFFLKVVDASVIFQENDEGEITSLILNQNDMRQPAPKL